MDLDFTEEQTMLRDTVRMICQQHYDMQVVRTLEQNGDDYPAEFWQALVQAGIAALAVPESYGGAGMGLLDAVVVGEESGRHLAASPLLVSSLLATKALEFAGGAASWLSAIAGGDAVVTVAQLEPDSDYSEQGINATFCDGRLNAEKILVPFAGGASHLLVLARENPDWVLCLISLDALSLQRQDNIADAALYKIRLENTPVDATNVFRLGENGWQTWQRAMSWAAVAAAAEAVGGAERMLGITAEYSKTRVQFGKPIGAFQALAHNMAELATEIEGCKHLVYHAAWACDSGKPWELLAAQAKLQAGDCFRRTTAVGTQIYGGLGFTREGDPQLYFRRAKLQQLLYWDPGYLEQRIAELLF